MPTIVFPSMHLNVNAMKYDEQNPLLPPQANFNLTNGVASADIDTANLLPVEERAQYQILVNSISTDVQRARRHCGLSEFIKHITLVHRFVRQGNSNDSLRGIVCGVEFGRGFILVNTDRLKKILFRSKSCMNGCFQRLGYDVMRPSHDLVCLFTRLLPSVKPEFFAIRQWCVRLVTDQCTVCFLSNMPDSIASSFEVHRIPAQRQFYQQQQTQSPPLTSNSHQISQLSIPNQNTVHYNNIPVNNTIQAQEITPIINNYSDESESSPTTHSNISTTAQNNNEHKDKSIEHFYQAFIKSAANKFNSKKSDEPKKNNSYSFLFDVRSLLNH